MAGAGPAKGLTAWYPHSSWHSHAGLPLSCQVPSSSLPWCLHPPPPLSSRNFPCFLLLSTCVAPHSDLSLRVPSFERTVTWLGSPKVAGRTGLLVISACLGSGLGTSLNNRPPESLVPQNLCPPHPPHLQGEHFNPLLPYAPSAGDGETPVGMNPREWQIHTSSLVFPPGQRLTREVSYWSSSCSFPAGAQRGPCILAMSQVTSYSLAMQPSPLSGPYWGSLMGSWGLW